MEKIKQSIEVGGGPESPSGIKMLENSLSETQINGALSILSGKPCEVDLTNADLVAGLDNQPRSRLALSGRLSARLSPPARARVQELQGKILQDATKILCATAKT